MPAKLIASRITLPMTIPAMAPAEMLVDNAPGMVFAPPDSSLESPPLEVPDPEPPELLLSPPAPRVAVVPPPAPVAVPVGVVIRAAMRLAGRPLISDSHSPDSPDIGRTPK